MDYIAANIAAVRERIAIAARRVGRAENDITLVGVSKTRPAEDVALALAAGLADFGENRVQEAEDKITELAHVRNSMRWHLIGHLQSNKARRAVALFDLLHSVDSLALAETLDRQTANHAPGKQIPVLLQVNVSGETTKEGFDLAGWAERPELFDTFRADVERILALPHLNVRGLMTIAPWASDPQAARPAFYSTARLRDTLAHCFPTTSWAELSMGMTDDFDVAIEEGATIVRVGRAIFGERGVEQ